MTQKVEIPIWEFLEGFVERLKNDPETQRKLSRLLKQRLEERKEIFKLEGK